MGKEERKEDDLICWCSSRWRCVVITPLSALMLAALRSDQLIKKDVRSVIVRGPTVDWEGEGEGGEMRAEVKLDYLRKHLSLGREFQLGLQEQQQQQQTSYRQLIAVITVLS